MQDKRVANLIDAAQKALTWLTDLDERYGVPMDELDAVYSPLIGAVEDAQELGDYAYNLRMLVKLAREYAALGDAPTYSQDHEDWLDNNLGALRQLGQMHYGPYEEGA